MNQHFSISILTFFLMAFIIPKVNGQYYYKDILNTKKINKEFSELKKGGILLISLKSFEDNDEPSEGFFAEKKINKNYSQSEMISRSYITEETLIKTDYDRDGRVIKTTTTTPTITNTLDYNYDPEGHLILITTSSFDDRDSGIIQESRAYQYNEGLPEKMVAKRNGSVLFTIQFIKDENGNIVEENEPGKTGDRKYYYYYDAQNRLTDVVRFNATAGRLLPDYMFEYESGNDLPSRMTTVEAGGSNYFIWRYAYTANHLPEIEKCYSKEKRLLGTIEYEYR